MCDGIPIFSNNIKAFHGVGTNSHSTAAEMLKIKEDEYMKSEYHWWDKTFVPDHYDNEGIQILKDNGVDIDKATKIAQKYVKTVFKTQDQLVKWLKITPSEWGKLMDTKHKSLAKKVNPKLLIYQDKIEKFKKEDIEKYNPYQATKLPRLEDIKKKIPVQVRAQVWAQVRAQVRAQVWAQVRDQVGAQVRDQVWAQVWAQVRDQVGDQVGDQVLSQVGDQVWDQVRDQVRATSYWAIKLTLGIPIKHWFFDFLKLGVMIMFVRGKVKVFGKKGMYLGEYDQKDFES